MELTTPPSKHIRILEVEVSSTITSGQSYYFKVGEIPVRAAWMRRDFNKSTKTSKYTAVLFALVDAEAPRELEESTSLLWLNESLDMLRASFAHAGFGSHAGMRIICYGKSYQYFRDNVNIRVTHDLAAVNGNLAKRKGDQGLADALDEAMRSGVIRLSSESNIEDVLRESVPGSKHLYAVGENLRSFGLRPKRLDFDGKPIESLDV
ncbi:hypothetical protein BDP55DRAFT_565017 [Colletotrichum godetiae]|uniref:Uncharacterized protein n=1 Tax=Colletotrichum godetiae TaxID=1209918 RepID=A0AAJ0ERH8_9PEZI|nr:uncharacterized protein BDP55DRAFT_565017 [Colletotrichum godetiae]KAK1658503.1 hypothetical protein BDP55DRAFT_565017 [Colletotrichum godetiae]